MNKARGGRSSSMAEDAAPNSNKDDAAASGVNKKDLIIGNFDERMHCMIKAFFNVWCHDPNSHLGSKRRQRQAIPAEEFYQKMTTFGLVPDCKFIENITTIVFFNRPKLPA